MTGFVRIGYCTQMLFKNLLQLLVFIEKEKKNWKTNQTLNHVLICLKELIFQCSTMKACSSLTVKKIATYLIATASFCSAKDWNRTLRCAERCFVPQSTMCPFHPLAEVWKASVGSEGCPSPGPRRGGEA